MTLKTCPTPDELQQLLLGKIGSEAAEWLEEHLLSCDQCVARAETLGTHDDLTSAIRARKILEGNEEVVAKVVDNLDRLYDSIDTTSSCDTKSGNDQSAASGSKPSAHDVASFLAPAEQPDEIGRLGSYRVLEVLGIGGMGVVFRAEDPHLKRQIALKAMKPELAATPSAKERFLREARSAAAIEHDNIVTIYQVGEDRGVPFLAMRFLRGESLQTRLKREKQLPIEEVLRIGRETASGLAAAHARGLIHRDIKPDNMWLESRSHLHSGDAQDEGDSQELKVTSQSREDVTRTQSDSQLSHADKEHVDRVKIVDFGLVRADDDIELTKTGVVMGTPRYMSPEQAQGQPVDHRSDLFSLGSVMYHLTTGEGPFDRGNMPSTLMAVIREDPDRIENHRSDAPRELKGLIVRLLEKNPDDRPQSAAEVVAAIREIESKLFDKTKPAIPKREPRVRPAKAPQAKKSGTRRRVVVGTAIVFPLLIVLGIVLLVRTPNGTLRIEVNDENLQVVVDGEQITLTDKQWEGKKKARKHQLAIKLGDQTLNIGKATAFQVDGRDVEHLLTVKLNGFDIESDEFEVLRGDDTVLTISLERPATLSAPFDAEAPPLAKAPFDEATAKQHQQAWADHLGVPVEKEIVVGKDEDGKDVTLTMVLIPPGEFMMGSTPEEQATFKTTNDPQHRVRITRPFYMGKHEVTQSQWQSVMGDNPSEWNDSPTDPVQQVNWFDVQGLIKKLNGGPQSHSMVFALPTEAQWEYACRAGTATTWHSEFGESQVREYGWFKSTRTHPVGQLRPNAFGLYDMYGNVWEWCADWYSESYYGIAPLDDPTGPLSGSARVKRGSYFRSATMFVRSAYRGPSRPNDGNHALGFRLAASIDTAKRSPPLAVAPFDADQAKQHQHAWADYLGVPVEKEIVVGTDEVGKDVTLTMVLIPPGEFMMGSTEEERARFLDEAQADDDQSRIGRTPSKWVVSNIAGEGPQHRVRITKPLYLGKYEVTQTQWQAVMGNNPSKFIGNATHPVETVRWDEIQSFAGKLNASDVSEEMTFALPTEAQWEYACRAGTATPYCGGESAKDLQEYAWFESNAGDKTHPVGELKPNAFGLYDVLGNVREWCADMFAGDYYAESPVDGPTGPSTEDANPALLRRVNRGGSWYDHPSLCRSAFRFAFIRTAGHYNDHLGFRMAASIELPKQPAKVAEVEPHRWPADAPALAIAPFDVKQAKSHQEVWADYLGLPVEKEIELPGGEKMTFMLIPPGEFLMGSTDEEQATFLRDKKAARAVTRSSVYYIRDEVPQHRVRITRPFYLGMCEVTQAQWQALMGSNPSNFQDHLTHPVEQVSWDDIQPFLAKLNEGLSATEPKFALPTETQWEFACRAGTIETWHIGDSAETLNEVAWFADNSYDSTHPVGRLKPNSFGLHDMHGNVGEWCADWHAGDYYSKTPADDPAGPPRGSYRVTRGGGYIARAAYCRSAIRHGRLPDLRHLNLGFRLAMTIDPSKLSPRGTASYTWTDLFNGKSLAGWSVYGTGDWSVDNGEIVCVGRKSKLVFEAGPFTDFDVRLECLLERDTNSGLFLRTGRSANHLDGYEIQLAKFEKYGTGSIWGRAAFDEPIAEDSTWFPVEAQVRGNRIKVFVNGRLTVDYADTKNEFQSGHIALQGHKGSGKVRFRKLQVRQSEDSERRIAQLFIDLGCSVQLKGGSKYLYRLPPGEVRVRGIACYEDSRVQDEHIPLLAQLPELEDLYFYACPVTDVGYSALDNLPSVKFIQFKYSSLGDRGLAALTSLKRLDNLSLLHTDVTDAGLKSLSQMPALTQLTLSNSYKKKRVMSYGPVAVTDDGLAHLASIDNLRNLWVMGPDWTDRAAEHLGALRQLSHLRELKLWSPKITDAAIPHLGSLPNLRRIILGTPNVSDKAMAELRKSLPRECRIDDYRGEPEPDTDDFGHGSNSRRGAEYITSIGGRFMTNLSEQWTNVVPDQQFLLTGVGLEKNGSVTDEGLAALRGCLELETLQLGWTGVTDACLVHFKDCKNLTSLSFGPLVTDEGLAHFTDCNRLESLILICSTQKITDDGLALFKNCKEMNYLYLHHANVGDAGMAELKDCQKLSELILDRSKVTDAGLAQFKEWKELESLTLSFTLVGDDGLAHLKDYPSLTYFSLKDAPHVTDAGLTHLQDCKGLTTFILRRSPRISAEMVARLKEALPNCRIDWDGEAPEVETPSAK